MFVVDGATPRDHVECDVELFFDGECPLCRREVALMRRFNRRGRVRFTDIAALAERAYATFARNRLRWTGRCTDDVCTPHSER